MKISGITERYKTLKQTMVNKALNKYVKYSNMSEYESISTTLEKANATRLMANYLKPYGLSVEFIQLDKVPLSPENRLPNELGSKIYMMLGKANNKGPLVSREIVAHPDAVYPFEKDGVFIRQVDGEQDLQYAVRTHSSYEDGLVRHIYRNLESAVKEYLKQK